MKTLATIPNAASKIGKTIRLFASPRPGERLRAVDALERLLRSVNMDFNNFAAQIEGIIGPNSHDAYRVVSWLRDHCHLSQREFEFISNMRSLLAAGRKFTPGQEKWLRDIYARETRSAAV
jgi:hypothetical protein